MIKPVKNAYTTSGYGKRILNGVEQFHDGIDFVNFDPVSKLFHVDKSVYAVADGVISFDYDIYDDRFRWINQKDSVGNMVILKTLIDNKQFCFRYCHLVTNIVKLGQVVKQGEKIGEYGDVGYSFGAHLHFDGSPGEIYDRSKRFDMSGMFK